MPPDLFLKGEKYSIDKLKASYLMCLGKTKQTKKWVTVLHNQPKTLHWCWKPKCNIIIIKVGDKARLSVMVPLKWVECIKCTRHCRLDLLKVLILDVSVDVTRSYGAHGAQSHKNTLHFNVTDKVYGLVKTYLYSFNELKWICPFPSMLPSDTFMLSFCWHCY